MHVYLYAMYVYASPRRSEKGVDSHKQELQAVVSHQRMWVIGTELRASRRTASALNLRVISPAPQFILSKKLISYNTLQKRN